MSVVLNKKQNFCSTKIIHPSVWFTRNLSKMKNEIFQKAKNILVFAKLGKISGSKGGSKSQNPCIAAIPAGYFKLKEKQEKFQKHDCKPIFLKGGILDQILYRLTWGMALVGIAGSVQTFIQLL